MATIGVKRATAAIILIVVSGQERPQGDRIHAKPLDRQPIRRHLFDISGGPVASLNAAAKYIKPTRWSIHQ